MRLVCPNCSAQYEIDGSMIPEEGRDVQCSNCGHTWFELPAATAERIEPEPEPADTAAPERAETRPSNLSRDVFEDDADRDEDDGWSTGEPEAEAAKRDAQLSDAVQSITRASEAAEAAEEAEAFGEPGEADWPEPADSAPAPRRPADAAALDILREEAERELSQRRASPPAQLETQADLGLDEVRKRKTPSRALRARMAHLGEDVEAEDEPGEPEEPAPPPRPASREDDPEDYAEPRRDLLPDIDEINSTLKPARRKEAGGAEAVRRSGFRAGFVLMILLVIAVVFVYAQAPAIARALPGMEVPLLRFVDAANAGRDWIDGMLAN